MSNKIDIAAKSSDQSAATARRPDQSLVARVSLPMDLIIEVMRFHDDWSALLRVSKSWKNEIGKQLSLILLEEFHNDPLVRRFVPPSSALREPKERVVQTCKNVTTFLEKARFLFQPPEFLLLREKSPAFIRDAIQRCDFVVFYRKLPLPLKEFGGVLSEGSVYEQSNRFRSLMDLHQVSLSPILTLNLSSLGLMTIPDEIRFFPNAARVNLSKNRIRDLTPLRSLAKATLLNLSENEITNLEGLNELTEITHLFLLNNQIREMGSLDRLSKLKTLNLRGNPITATEEQIRSLLHEDVRWSAAIQLDEPAQSGMRALTSNPISVSNNAFFSLSSLASLSSLSSTPSTEAVTSSSSSRSATPMESDGKEDSRIYSPLENDFLSMTLTSPSSARLHFKLDRATRRTI